MKKYFLSVVVLILVGKASYSQQDPMNTQYIFNKLFINPAYAGYKEQPNFVVMHRNQWIGFKGAPMTSVISFDTPLKKDEFATGATMMFDKIGPQSRLAASLDFTYRMRLTNRATLSLGLKASAILYQANLTDLLLHSDYTMQQDEAFMYNVNNLLLYNFGFGAYYYKKDHFIGISVPHLLRHKLDDPNSEGYALFDGRYEPLGIITAGKLWKINKQVKIQPNIVIRGQMNAPISAGVYLNFILMDQFTVGGYYYVQESAGALLQWQMNKQFKLGYSFDLPVNRLITTGFGSHELAASYILPTRKKRIIYPRYF